MSTAEPSPPAANSRRFRWRRLLQFQIRTLLILTTICAMLFAWWSHKARQQRQAVAAIEALAATDMGAGFVQYDFHDLKLDCPPNWPKWLVDALGVDYFANVTRVGIVGRHVTSDKLEFLKGLPALRELYLISTSVNDVGLKHFKGLAALQLIDLSDTFVTDAGLEHLKGMMALQELHLNDTRVTDAGLEHLQELTGLQALWLYKTQVTDAGVAQLKQALPKCQIKFDWNAPQ